jgi:hypothetical protein
MPLLPPLLPPRATLGGACALPLATPSCFDNRKSTAESLVLELKSKYLCALAADLICDRGGLAPILVGENMRWVSVLQSLSTELTGPPSSLGGECCVLLLSR